MLTSEQVKHFQNCVTRAKKILACPLNETDKAVDIRYHIRVSRRQMASGQWSLGIIFGTKRENEWLKIIDVTEDEMRPMVTEYRDLLHTQIHKI